MPFIHTIQTSASGKVLIIGGYAILLRPNKGLVLATTSRFHTTIALQPREQVSTQVDSHQLLVRVVSPQYQQELDYLCERSGDGVRVLAASSNAKSNAYVEQTVGLSLSAVAALRPSSSALAQIVDDITHARTVAASFDQLVEAIDQDLTITFQSQSRDVPEAVLKVVALADTLKLDRTQLDALLHLPSAIPEVQRVLDAGLPTIELSDVQMVSCSFHFMMVYAARNNLMLHVTLQADNDFYSQSQRLKAAGLPLTAESLRNLPEFVPCSMNSPSEDGKTIEVSKTGLGSSATMITSLSAAMLCMFGVVDPAKQASKEQVDLIHKVAQLNHGVAQGKIGSGFDVCVAVHGGMNYVRYSPSVLKPVMDWSMDEGLPGPQLIRDCLGEWDHVVEPFSLPRGLHMMCGDICGGSETPSMSRKILAWKASGREGHLWDELVAANDSVAADFGDLSAFAASVHESCEGQWATYDAAIEQYVSGDPSSPVQDQNLGSVFKSLSEKLDKLRTHFAAVRSLLKRIGDLAEVPVEPDCQTNLCNETQRVAGVLVAGVPGAGGYDAIYTIYCGESTRESVEACWKQYNQADVCPLLLSEVDESTTNPGLVINVL